MTKNVRRFVVDMAMQRFHLDDFPFKTNQKEDQKTIFRHAGGIDPRPFGFGLYGTDVEVHPLVGDDGDITHLKIILISTAGQAKVLEENQKVY